MKLIFALFLLPLIIFNSEARVIDYFCEDIDLSDGLRVNLSVSFDGDKPVLTNAYLKFANSQVGFKLGQYSEIETTYKSNRYWLEISIKDSSKPASDIFVLRLDREKGQVSNFLNEDDSFRASIYTTNSRGFIWLKPRLISCSQ